MALYCGMGQHSQSLTSSGTHFYYLPVVNVFVDETGDLGFSPSSTKSFVLGYVIMTNDVPIFIRNKVTRLLKNLNTKKTVRGKWMNSSFLMIIM